MCTVSLFNHVYVNETVCLLFTGKLKLHKTILVTLKEEHMGVSPYVF